MIYDILDIGKFIGIDRNGFLKNEYSLDKIKPPFNKPIDCIIKKYKEAFKQNIRGIYVRGSVARGNPIEGFSDFDCFAILENKPTENEIRSIRQASIDLLHRFDFVSNFDLFYFRYSSLFNDPNYAPWKFAIKIHSVCIYGENIIHQLPDYKVDSKILFALYHLENRIKNAKENICLNFDPISTRYWCSWIMRTIVRAGLEITTNRHGKYTNELALCYKTFSKYYPEKSTEMFTALQLSINPSTNFQIIFELIDSLGAWLIKERISFWGC